MDGDKPEPEDDEDHEDDLEELGAEADEAEFL